MCGIIGVFSKSPFNDTYLNNHLQLLTHRGSDDYGVWEDDYIRLGHTRLSILDLSPLGHQPMSYQNKRYWITFNGEIYNYLEIKQELINFGHQFISNSDTEVLLIAYVQWGISCLDKLRGMFAFGIWDKHQKEFFIARDRIGEKPLYYTYDKDKFYFASELKALISLLPNLPTLDAAAIDLYLHYQYVPEPLTPLNGIYKLQAAHYLLLDCNQSAFTNTNVVQTAYWNLSDIPPITGEPISLIREELDRTIALTLRSDVPIGIALSGGIDSGAIASLAAPKYKDTLQAFSIGYPNRPAYDERDNAKELAQSLNLPFHEVELSTKDFVDFFPSLVAASDDPVADIAAYGHYAVMNAASKHGIKVMLSGIGGDELFWGYSWTQRAVKLTAQKLNILNFLRSSNQSSQIILQILQGLFSGISKASDTELYNRLANSHKLPKSLRAIFSYLLELSFIDPAYPLQAIYQNQIPDFRIYNQLSGEIYTKEFAAKIPLRNAYRPFQLPKNTIKDLPIQICQILFDTWLASNCLALGDRLSMASSVELRLPLLDYKLIELVMGLRQVYPDHALESKSWLKSALKDILPNTVLSRKKQGFQPPTDEWINAVIHRYGHWLDNGYLINLGVFDKKHMNQLLETFTSSGKYRFIIYKILILETWYRKVVIKCL